MDREGGGEGRKTPGWEAGGEGRRVIRPQATWRKVTRSLLLQAPWRVYQNVVRTRADLVQRGWWVMDDSSLFSAQNPRGRPPEIAALIPLGRGSHT